MSLLLQALLGDWEGWAMGASGYSMLAAATLVAAMRCLTSGQASLWARADEGRDLDARCG